MNSLHMKMMLLLAALFAVIYAIITMFGTAMGVHNFSVYLVVAVIMMGVQYMIGPSIVQWSMRVRYIERHENSKLYDMIEDQARRANIPMPRVGISQMPIPNAFAFGRSLSDGRVCVTEGIMQLLNDEELKAVIGHEISHLKNRDMITITLLSVIPMIMYRIAWHFLFFGSFSRRREGAANTALVGLAALVFYFITNLLVLYASRIREYFADKGSVALGNRPSALASALYKLVYGSARIDKRQMKEAEGMKAFFVNDPSQAYNELKELSQVDRDRNGTIDDDELAAIRSKTVRLENGDRIMEAMSTHPNMLKRIRHLASLGE